ncbi:MAG: orotidine-5'-phosphate decarboxylase [Solirubrobacteraceae bacterium]
MSASFGERLAAQVAERRSQIVLGLDPDPARLWPAGASAAEAARGDAAERVARGVVAHCQAVIDAAGAECVAVKPQVACFERLGAPGWSALREVAAHARTSGLLVIADGKRGDIDVSAAAYAQAFFGGVSTPWGDISGLEADALTVSPLLGADSIEPFLTAARPRGAGLFLLVRTSNQGARDVQEAELATGGIVSDRIARLVDRLGSSPAALSDVGAVVGATAPEHLARLRELMPRAVFLLPGVGAQGGRVEALAPAFAPGRAGGLIAASRGIVGAHESAGGDPATSALSAAAALREQAWALGASGA